MYVRGPLRRGAHSGRPAGPARFRGGNMTPTPAHATGHRRLRGKVTITLLVLLFTAGLVWGIAAAVAADSPSPSASSNDLTVRLGTTFDADNLNPFIGYSGTSYEIFPPQLRLPGGLRSRPVAAAGAGDQLDHVADGKTWTFQLRQGVKWQDGQPFTSKDVAFTYKPHHQEQPHVVHELHQQHHQGRAPGRLRGEGGVQPAQIQHAAPVDPHLPEHIWAKVPPATLTTSFVNKPPIIGTGPFQTTEVKKGGYIKLVKNPNYWTRASRPSTRSSWRSTRTPTR